MNGVLWCKMCEEVVKDSRLLSNWHFDFSKHENPLFEDPTKKLLWVLVLYQQPHNPRLQITACLSLPAQALSFASPQGSSLECSQRALCSGLRQAVVLLSPICLGDMGEVPQQQRGCCGLKSCCQSMDGKKDISSNS